MNVRQTIRGIISRLRPQQNNSEPLDEQAIFRADVARRILLGDADPVLDLLHTGDLTWDAVFGMDGYILMQTCIPGLDLSYFSMEMVSALEFFDQAIVRLHRGHQMLRHDHPRNRWLGFVDVTAREIAYTGLATLKESNLRDHPGWALYMSFPSSQRNARIPDTFK